MFFHVLGGGGGWQVVRFYTEPGQNGKSEVAEPGGFSAESGLGFRV